MLIFKSVSTNKKWQIHNGSSTIHGHMEMCAWPQHSTTREIHHLNTKYHNSIKFHHNIRPHNFISQLYCPLSSNKEIQKHINQTSQAPLPWTKRPCTLQKYIKILADMRQVFDKLHWQWRRESTESIGIKCLFGRQKLWNLLRSNYILRRMSKRPSG